MDLCETTDLLCVFPYDMFQYMVTSIRIVNKWISLRTMNELKVLCARLAKYRFGRHRLGEK